MDFLLILNLYRAIRIDLVEVAVIQNVPIPRFSVAYEVILICLGDDHPPINLFLMGAKRLDITA